MAFSKARRLGDLVSATGEVSAFADASIVPADLHATLDLTGKTITVATASASDNDTTVASTAFVQQELASLVDSAPGTLNTLNELAAALGDDASFSTTVTNSIATKLPLAGGTLTGDLTLGDNVKAIFGAGSDLKIYHSGSESRIDENGVGNLKINANNFEIYNSASSEAKAKFNTDGSVELYYDNSLKLLTSSTGINLPLDGESIKFGANSEILLTHEHDLGLALQGALKLSNNETDDTNKEGHLLARQYDSGTETEGFQILQYFANSSGNRIDIGGASSQHNAATEINFYTAANTTTRTGTSRLTIDSSGNLTLGSDSVASSINILGDVFTLDVDSNGNTGGTPNMRFAISGSEKVRIDSSGRVGIGTSNPSTLLHINGSGDAIRVESTNAGAGGAQVDLLHYSASPADNDVHGVINFGGYYSGSSQAYGSAIKSVWSDVSAKKGKMELHTRNDSDFAARMTINEDGYVTLSRNANEYGLELRSTGTRSGIVLATPNSGNTIKASMLLLTDNTLRLGTQSVYNIHMNQSGHNTMPNQPYMRAYGNYGGMASSHGTTEDPWNHWAVGSSSGITHSNGVFTVPTTGRYLITYSFYNWMNNTGKGVTHAAYLYVGSTNVQETNNEADFEDDAYSYYDNTLSNSIIYNLTAGDTFKFVTYADIYGGVAHTNMSAYLLG